MRSKLGLGLLAAVGAFALGMSAQAAPAIGAGTLITGPINNRQLVTLPLNTRPEAMVRANDRGALPDSTPFGGQLLLKRSAMQEKAFEKAIDALHNPKSPSFHRWLTNAQIGQRYGMSNQDLSKIVGWMKSQGFKVSGISPDRMFVNFSGTVGQIRTAFHTSIHKLNVDGVGHFANMSDPQIPAALSRAVAGVVSMNDFRPHPMRTMRFKPSFGPKKNGNYTVAAGCFPAAPTNHGASFTGRCFLVTPADLATIYNFKAAFNAGITGHGQTVVVVEDTNVFKEAAWNVFRNIMGINPANYGNPTFTEVHPTGTQACANPGVIWGNDGEAILDAEYASASAPGANIVLASCSDTGTTNAGFGGLKAIINMMAQNDHPNIFSMSYGECETENGATANAAFNTAYQSAAAEGISIYVSSGDESATSCDANAVYADHGVGVSGFMSSPYDISVGGTDWAMNTDPGSSTAWQTYWSDTNGAGLGSAKSYVPEIPWNDSCASEVMASFYTGSSVTYGTSGFCNNSFATSGNEFLSTGSGSGGPSGCATGTYASGTANRYVVSGTCAGWPKPSYQAGFKGIVADGVRDTPDVSLFAANGVWGSWYPFCDFDPAALGSTSTANAPGCLTTDPYNWAGAGGTSFSSPIWAGIQALINQKTGQAWGNTNVQYYALAAAEYGANGNASCDSSLGNASSSTCVFHDVTAGDFNVNCRALSGTKHNCYLPSGTNGVGTTDLTNNSYAPMYKSAVGWDFTTGIGTPNVGNLVNAFASISPSKTGTFGGGK